MCMPCKGLFYLLKRLYSAGVETLQPFMAANLKKLFFFQIAAERNRIPVVTGNLEGCRLIIKYGKKQ